MAILKTAINFDRSDYNKVACIKALRSVSGIGLKEAKDAVEEAAEGISFDFIINPALDPRVVKDAMDVLEANGFMASNVIHAVEIILESTKQSAILAVKSDDHDLAKLLLNVLTEYEAINEARAAAIMKRSEDRKEAAYRDKLRKDKDEDLRAKAEKRVFESDKLRENINF